MIRARTKMHPGRVRRALACRGNVACCSLVGRSVWCSSRWRARCWLGRKSALTLPRWLRPLPRARSRRKRKARRRGLHAYSAGRGFPFRRGGRRVLPCCHVLGRLSAPPMMTGLRCRAGPEVARSANGRRRSFWTVGQAVGQWLCVLRCKQEEAFSLCFLVGEGRALVIPTTLMSGET